MKKQRFIFLSIFLFGCFISCNNGNPVVHSFKKTEKNTSASRAKTIEDSRKQKLSSMLYELAIASDPEDFAKKHHIFLSEDRVKVYIFFDPDVLVSEKEMILNKFNIMIEKKSNGLVRALVPINRLIPLSKESVIRSIRLPDKLINAGKINP
jgi:hypothetical protein